MSEKDMRRANETACERGIEEDMRRANETACERGAGRHAKALEDAERRDLRDWLAGLAMSGMLACISRHLDHAQPMARAAHGARRLRLRRRHACRASAKGSLMPYCRSCEAEILWGETASGKRMPLDASPTEDIMSAARERRA